MGSEGSEGSKGSTISHFGQWCFLNMRRFFLSQDDEMRRTTLVKSVEPFLP